MAGRIVVIVAWVAAAWVAGAYGLPNAAHACKCSAGDTTLRPPALQADTSQVRTIDDVIDIRCEDRALQQCTWDQRYTVRNLGDTPATVTGLAGDDLRDPKVHLRTGTFEQRQAVEGIAIAPNEIAFTVLPGGEAELLIQGAFSFTEQGCGCWDSGLRRRHPVVSRGSDPEQGLVYVFDRGLPRSDTGSTEVHFDYPGAGAITSAHGDQRRALHRGRLGSEHRTEGRFGHEPIALFFRRRPPFVRGGPFIGVGGGWGSERALRLRAGYEVAAPRWLVFSGAVESDTTDLRFVPAVAVTSGHAIIPLLPGAAIGVGMPVQIDRSVGFRAQAELFWYFVGVFAAVDVYRGPDGARVVGSLIGQLSF